MCNKAVLFSLVEAIANFLPDEWRFNYRVINTDDNRSTPQILGDSGAVIEFRLRSDKKNMVSVTGKWPKIKNDPYYKNVNDWGVLKKGADYPTINFNLTRKADVLANDLFNRFIINYVDLYDKCLIERENILKKRENIKHKIAAMGRVFPIVYHEENHKLDLPKVNLPGQFDKFNGVVSFKRTDNFDLHLNNCTLEDTIKILAILNK